MRKVIIIKAFILLIFVFCALCLSGCNRKDDKYTKDYGSFYSIEEAYKEGLINYEELLSLAYYQNKGIIGNEKIMKEGYQPISIEPNNLDDSTIHKIKATNATTKKEYDSFEVYDYFGTYHGAIAIKIKSSLYDIPAVITEVSVEDIFFIFPNHIMYIWKET